MNDPTRAALDRMLRGLDRARPRRRPAGFSTAPLVVAGAGVLGYQLLVRLVPAVWANVLPGGFAQGPYLPGGAPLVWRAAWTCHLHFVPVALGIGVATVLAAILGRRPLTRPLAWGLAVLAIGLDAAILVLTLRAGMDAAGVGQVL